MHLVMQARKDEDGLIPRGNRIGIGIADINDYIYLGIYPSIHHYYLLVSINPFLLSFYLLRV